MNSLRHIGHCVALALLLAGSSQAVNLVFTPTLLNINAARTLNASTTVQNRDTVPVEFTAEAMRWTQVDGKDVLEPTPEVLVNPPRFTVAPGHTQTVRVGLRARTSLPEATYRIVLTGTPKTAAVGAVSSDRVGGTVTTRYAFSLPLFVTAPGAAATLHLQLTRSADGLLLKTTNAGTAAASLRNIQVQVGNEAVPVGGAYVLAGSTVTLPLPKRAYPQDGLLVSYLDQGKTYQERLAIPAP